MFGLGHWEIILILVIVLIVFGAGKLPKVAGELAPDPLNIDRLRLNRLLHQTPDLPDK